MTLYYLYYDMLNKNNSIGMSQQNKSPIHQKIKFQPFVNIPKRRRLSCSNTNPKADQKKNQNIDNNYYKNHRKRSTASNIQTIQTSYNKIQMMRQQQKNKWNLNTRNIFAFFPTYTTLVDNQAHLRGQQEYQFASNKQKIIIKQEDIEFDSLEKGKLAPLRRVSRQNSLSTSKKTFNLSFFNVQKVSLLPITNFKYTNDVRAKNSLTAAVINNKRALVIPRQSFDESDDKNMLQKYFEVKQKIDQALLLQQKELIELKTTVGTKNELNTTKSLRTFVPPFQRYYYFDFLWKIAFSNKIYAEFIQNLPRKYKVYIGPGNNSMLIKTLFKRRESWWSITQKIDEANFVWTQIKVSNIFNAQKSSPKKLNHQSQKQLNQPQQKNQAKKHTLQYKRNAKILNTQYLTQWIQYFQKNRQVQQKLAPTFSKRNKIFKSYKLKSANQNSSQTIKMHNHLPQNYVLGNKKALFATMKNYYQKANQEVFKHIPLTFHIQNGIEDRQYSRFLQYFYKQSKQMKQQQSPQIKSKSKKNIWIVKPGQFTNRGHGITVCHTIQEVKAIVKNKRKLDNGNKRTYIIQQYLDKPFLYQKRKFDIRHYMMITSVNGHIKGYWYEQGYIRTTSYEYSSKNNYTSVHLTNDAVQKHLPDYGKYEKGNKISYDQFEKYLQKQYKGKYSFFKQIYPQLRNIASDCMKASALMIDEERKQHNFQIFGFDFMIDAEFNPWLIQINTNPCLQLSSPVLMDVIPGMVQNALKIGVDSVLHPPYGFSEKRTRFSSNVLQDNKFELLYDSQACQQNLRKIFNNDIQATKQIKFNYKQLQKDQQQVYEDDGVQLED